MAGYTGYAIVNNTRYFEGPILGEAHVQVPHLLRRWNEIKTMIDTPFILLHAGNENWGIFSTEFPNRTASWTQCCDDYPDLKELLNHPMTLAVLTNQHHNLTHPKVISLPRGIPNHEMHQSKFFFDSLRTFEVSLKKDALVFASNSDWKHRPFISKCIAAKFAPEGDTHFNHYEVGGDGKEAGRLSEKQYYRKIAASRTVVCLAGLGYDSYRYETVPANSAFYELYLILMLYFSL
jgi:hypothetical protein